MKFAPHDYQRYCIQRLITDAALGLFLDMGLGKTVITLTAVNDLRYNRFAVCKVLVIAPKKVAEATWSKEAAKWDHLKHLRISLILGSAQKRIRAVNTPADVYVINRENVCWLVEYFRNAWPFDMVVVDESSSFKSHQAKRFKSLTWVRQSMKRIVLLTGTPAPNGLTDLWAQVYLLDQGERLGKHITHYRERYFSPDQRNAQQVFSYVPKPGADEIIHQLISDICVSMKAEDYLQLPDITVDDIPVVLDPSAQKQYDKMEREMLLQVDESTIDAGSAAALSNKLLQLCNGAAYDDKGVAVEIHDCKIEAFMELIEQLNGQPALVFYYFKHDLTRLERALSKTGLRVKRMDGPADEDAWNAKRVDVLLAQPQSTAYGLNLQDGGNHIIWFCLPNFNLEWYIQSNARLRRQGQLQKVINHRLNVVGGRDEDMIDALEDKGATQDRLLESLKARIEKIKQADSK